MTCAYSAFGLRIGSAVNLPELASGEPPFDVQITRGRAPAALSEAARRGVWYHVAPRQFLLEIPDVARYYARDGREVIVDAAPGASDAAVRQYLLGSVFGALLHQRGALPIHGSAVATARGGVIFVGPSGRGKSTLAWEFHRRGCRFLSDDVSVVGFEDGGRPLVYPAYPQVSLWHDVLEQHPDRVAAPPAYPALQKCAIPTRDTFQSTPVSLVAVYLLTITNRPSIQLASADGLDKVQVLLSNTYRPGFVADTHSRAAHFTIAAVAGRRLMTRRVERPERPFMLRELADRIEEDLGL